MAGWFIHAVSGEVVIRMAPGKGQLSVISYQRCQPESLEAYVHL
jgi:hypothetical protein